MIINVTTDDISKAQSFACRNENWEYTEINPVAFALSRVFGEKWHAWAVDGIKDKSFNRCWRNGAPDEEFSLPDIVAKKLARFSYGWSVGAFSFEIAFLKEQTL